MEIKGDITPAIDELRTIYDKLRTHYEGRAQNKYWIKNSHLRPVVIGITPARPRSKEEGWYQAGTWESEGETVFKTLTKQKDPAVYDEIFIVGETLANPSIDVVRNMVHQFAHQISATIYKSGYNNSARTYHNAQYEYAAGLLGINAFYVKGTGWTIDWNQQNPVINDLLQKIADEIDPMAFDTFRKVPSGRAVQSTRMKKWQCKSCLNPKVVRCTGLLKAECKRCGDPFIYADKDRHTDLQVKHWVNYSNCEVLP